MTDHNTTVCVAVLALAAVEIAALAHNINGALLTMVVAAISALVGMKAQQTRVMGYYPRGGPTPQSAAAIEPKARVGTLLPAPIHPITPSTRPRPGPTARAVPSGPERAN